ncbi:unnamed protein product [Spirodela intermedia]|uniref:Uncharacterized protein n=2 Tax=Spirodela intermedia TaxID=51605 RepID=A0A7I8JW73_SPIIN|nr:unnamed protein product [Spirodela intermedia]CAA6673722.1 unnamed protein product [Spirodela intermedia]CAA7410962.1 unnamed protein product [Spirodela intermedia]
MRNYRKYPEILCFLCNFSMRHWTQIGPRRFHFLNGL